MPAPWYPPTEQLWNGMKQMLESVSMPLNAHQLVQQILGDVERQSQINGIRNLPQPPQPPKLVSEGDA